MKIIDERETQKKKKKQRQKRLTETNGYSERWELNDFGVRLVRFSLINM